MNECHKCQTTRLTKKKNITITHVTLGFEPDSYIFTSFLHYYTHTANWDKIDGLVKLANENRHTSGSLVFYSVLSTALMSHHRTEQAWRTFQTMEKKFGLVISLKLSVTTIYLLPSILLDRQKCQVWPT